MLVNIKEGGVELTHIIQELGTCIHANFTLTVNINHVITVHCI